MSQSKRTWRRRIGRVTVYLRGSRYWIYYRQGKQVRRPVGTNKEEALALAAKINAQLAEGAPTILAFQPIAVDALVAKWLDHHEHVRRSSLATVRRYAYFFGLGLPEAVALRYHRSDLEVDRWPSREITEHPPANAYIFSYDFSEDELRLVHKPRWESKATRLTYSSPSG